MVIHVEMQEWQTITPQEDSRLQHVVLDQPVLVEALRHAINLKELRSGLSIETTSFVGRIRVGELHLTVRPKIQMNCLFNLLRYAYRLRDLSLSSVVRQTFSTQIFQDLLIHQLIVEVQELIGRGLERDYIRRDESLSAPKGRIDVQAIARQGGIRQAALPCIHHPREYDTLLNQILLAGLRLSARLTDDLELRATVRRLSARLEQQISTISLDFGVIDEASRQITRLNDAYQSTMNVIRLLLAGQGLSLETSEQHISLPGFLFDMNHFWETLLSRFLSENLLDYEVQDQHRLKRMMRYLPAHNPQRRRSPTPRPDYAIFRNGQIISLIDAKYRNLWKRSLPSSMLYQLSLYALSQGPDGHATILYPVTDDVSEVQVIEIQEAIRGTNQAYVELKPVNVYRLEELLNNSDIAGKQARYRYAEKMIRPLL